MKALTPGCDERGENVARLGIKGLRPVPAGALDDYERGMAEVIPEIIEAVRNRGQRTKRYPKACEELDDAIQTFRDGESWKKDEDFRDAICNAICRVHESKLIRVAEMVRDVLLNQRKKRQ